MWLKHKKVIALGMVAILYFSVIFVTTGAQTFPFSTILDNFNRSNGTIGTSWGGSTSGFAIVSQTLRVVGGGTIFWKNTSFGANQEAYYDFNSINTSATEIDLVLKSQSNTSTSNLLEVFYDPSLSRVQVWTSTAGSWTQRGSNIPVSFTNGDTFGARAAADGTVTVYKNGTSVGSVNASSWTYSASGGYNGIWVIGGSNMRLDNFGGGNYTPTGTSTPTPTATPTPTPTPTPSPTPLPTPTITLPTTTLSVDAGATTGSNGWYISSVPITLSATAGTNPVQSITYWIDSGTPTIVNSTTTTITLITQGIHTLHYYATDTGNNNETTKTFNYKIDVVVPGNWANFVLTNTGNAHTFSITVNVGDVTSGLDNVSADFQYSVDDGTTWGYYSTLTSCSSTWNNDLWKTTTISPNTAGTFNATISIPLTDYCNSNWAETKYIRIRIKDMAGNSNYKQYAIMAPWIQTTIGDIYSQGNIDMTSENGVTATGIVTTGGTTINNMTSSTNWSMKNYPITSNSIYTEYFSKLGSTATSIPGSLPLTSGVYKVNNSVTLSNIPSGISSVQNYAQIYFINGDLFIDDELQLHPTTTIIFIVSGDIGINKNVTRADGIYISDGEFNTSYNGSSSTQLTITGGVVANGGIAFPRSLSGTTNMTTPAEKIIYTPQRFANSTLLSLLRVTPTTTWKDVIEY